MAANKKIDFTELSIDELHNLQEKLETHLESLRKLMQVREEIIKKVLRCSEVKSICKQHDFNIGYLFNPPTEAEMDSPKGKKTRATRSRAVAVTVKPKKKRVVLPKYRLPTGETWSGRGLMPKIFTRYMERGGKLADVAIR